MSHCQCMVLTVYALTLEEILVCVMSVSLSMYGLLALNLVEILVRVISVSFSAYGPYGIWSET